MKYRCPKCYFTHEVQDEAVVARFNELVKDGKVEGCVPNGTIWVHVTASYRLRPAPQYRQFTAVEAAAHLGRTVEYHSTPGCVLKAKKWSVGESGIYMIDSALVTYEKMAKYGKFTDTGEPFGVKVD